MQILHNVLFVNSGVVYGGGFIAKTIFGTNTTPDDTLTVYDYIKVHTNSVVLKAAYSSYDECNKITRKFHS